jgi:hypothetical protein
LCARRQPRRRECHVWPQLTRMHMCALTAQRLSGEVCHRWEQRRGQVVPAEALRGAQLLHGASNHHRRRLRDQDDQRRRASLQAPNLGYGGPGVPAHARDMQGTRPLPCTGSLSQHHRQLLPRRRRDSARLRCDRSVELELELQLAIARAPRSCSRLLTGENRHDVVRKPAFLALRDRNVRDRQGADHPCRQQDGPSQRAAGACGNHTERMPMRCTLWHLLSSSPPKGVRRGGHFVCEGPQYALHRNECKGELEIAFASAGARAMVPRSCATAASAGDRV